MPKPFGFGSDLDAFIVLSDVKQESIVFFEKTLLCSSPRVGG